MASSHKRRKGRPAATRPSRPTDRQIPLDALGDAADSDLHQAYLLFAQELAQAQALADQRGELHRADPSLFLDLRAAGRVLDQYPQLGRYLEQARAREESKREQDLRLTKESPTGYPSRGARGDLSSLGGWAGVTAPGFNGNQAVGIHNTRQLREWGDTDEWVNSAINFYAEKVSHADIAILPADTRKPYNRGVSKSVELLLDQPNELRDSWPLLIGQFVRDLLTVGQGVLTKNMTLKRVPVALYAENAANLKIYSGWTGDPDEPRYLYQEGSGDWGTASGALNRPVLLRNDEAIVAPFNPTTYRYGWGPVQVLAETIDADLRATQAARHLVDFRSPPHLIDIPKASDQQIRTLRSTYESEVMGRREILFIGSQEGNVRVSPLVFSARDNQWLEWQEYLVRKICAVFQCSPQDLGITMDINKATSGSQQEISESKGFVPLLLLIEGYLNRELLVDFAPKLPMGRSNLAALNLRILFPQVSESARKAHAAEAIALASESLAGLPSATLNQILAMRGEEPVAGGNTFWSLTKNGPMPWLSYDDDLGSWLPPLGAQDAAGGPTDQAAEEIAADDQSDDDATSTNLQGAASSQETSGSPPAASQTANTSTPSTASSASGAASAAGQTSKGLANGTPARKGRPRYKAVPARSFGNTQCMVAFFLDSDTAQHLADPVAASIAPCCQAELPGDLHCTLALLGDASSWDDARVARVSSALALFAQQQRPLTGQIGGIGRFLAPAGQPTPLYASVDAPDLPTFREDLLRVLASVNVEVSHLHGYSPHITLAYLEPGQPLPIQQVPALPLSFAGVTLAVADARYTFPLAGLPAPQADAALVQASRTAGWQATLLDGRKPGTAWSPTQTLRLFQPVAPSSLLVRAQTHASGASVTHDEQARASLAAAVTRVFGDVVARGHQEVGR